MKKKVILGVVLLLLASTVAFAETNIKLVPGNDIQPGDSFAFVNQTDYLGMTVSLTSAMMDKGYEVTLPENAKFIGNFNYSWFDSWGLHYITKFNMIIYNRDKKVVATVLYQSMGIFTQDGFAKHIVNSFVEKVNSEYDDKDESK